jgi:gluconate 2-dehydrogenase gamma chain
MTVEEAPMTDKTSSPKTDTPALDRRTLLIGSALGAASSVGAMTPAEAAPNSQTAHSQKGHAGSAQHSHQRQGTFLNDDDYATVIAFTERLMPGAPGKPGAKDANVANYIDLALSGAYTDQQYFYRQGLEALETHCQAKYKKSFMFLTVTQQDAVLAAMDENKATGFTWSAYN